MNQIFNLDKTKKQPIYLQIVESVKQKIKDGALHTGDQLPSINQLSAEFNLAKETVVKAFRILQENGIVKAVHGKGYFVLTEDIRTEHRVFVLFDTLSAYKEVMYNAIKDSFGKHAFIDIYFHHFNPKVFNKLIADAAGNYASYIILPFDSPEIPKALKLLPREKVFLVDRKPRLIKEEYSFVYQDFHADVFSLFDSLRERIKKYTKLVLVFRNTITQVPLELREGFEQFCQENGIAYEVTERPLVDFPVEMRTGYVLIDDEDLVYLVEQAISRKMTIGKDLGIISYNETSLKKVVAGGISVISTDFGYMGRTVASMIKEGVGKSIKNPSRFIDRNSF